MALKFEPDLSLILKWDHALDESLPHQAPFVSQFEIEGKSLRYIASKHEGGVESPTLKTVLYEFDEFKPDVVILEGMPTKDECPPSEYLEHCRRQGNDNFKNGGEGSYACVLAGERNIEFVSGEPTKETLCQGIIEQGFSFEDVLGWHISTMIKQHLRDGTVDEINICERVESCANNFVNSQDRTNYHYRFEDFKHWYEARMNKEFTLEEIENDNDSPSTDPNANFLQKLMSAADQVREPNILSVIADQMTKHNRVLVVYGSAHLGKHEPVLSKMIGPVLHLKHF